MNDIVIRVNKLSKSYKINSYGQRGLRKNRRILSQDLSRLVRKSNTKPQLGRNDIFWALKDISFQVREGDVVGIIGSNGAGKSTLLKILSRITEPTSGRAEIYGRVGSLLEVGTGFHSELTGRENIFVGGAVLGMARKEINQKFDEIVDFSGVEKFLDTPVKRFSSGMEIRLAFSVAAHLNPQVLLVDEVLSVGDAAFRKKSLRKIQDVSLDGGAILFVSHNMTTVSALCNRAMVLNQGEIEFPIGPVAESIDHYLTNVQNSVGKDINKGRRSKQTGKILITGFGVYDQNNKLLEGLSSGESVKFQIEYENNDSHKAKNLNASILIKTSNGNIIANLDSRVTNENFNNSSGPGEFICRVQKLPLAPGSVNITLVLRQESQVIDLVEDVFVGFVDGGQRFASQQIEGFPGLIQIDQEWKIT